ncbi:MAG: TolC family protein, partial [Spirochaetales bacterium]|nr:TolC family protein [Spirochaetales bacterium]
RVFWAPACLPAEPLSFERVLELAGQRSEVLMLDRSAVKRAGMYLAETRSRFGPELTFQASGSCLASPPEGIAVQAGELGVIPNPSSPSDPFPIPAEALTFVEDARHGYFELSLQLSQPLYTWGKLKSSAELAELGLAQSRLELEHSRRQLHQDVHAAYFAALLARRSAELLEQVLDILEEIAQDRQRAFELGSANRLSLLQARTQISMVQRRIVQAREAHASSLEALALYTDVEPGNLELSTGFRRQLPDLAEVELKQKALASSPAMKKARLEQQQALVNLARVRGEAALRPDLSFNLSLEISGQTIPWGEESWDETWDLDLIAGVGARGSLFDSGRSAHQMRQAQESLEASRIAVDLVSKRIRLETRRAVEALRLRWAELQEAESALLQAREEAKNAGLAFQQQLATREQWGTARIALLQRELSLLEREYSFELSLYTLESIVGFRWTGERTVPIN